MAKKLTDSSKKEERKVKYYDVFKPNIEQKPDAVKSQQYVKKKIPEKIELTQEQVWDLKRPKYVLYDTKEKPSSDTRTSALRNADYWDPIKGASERNKSKMDNGKHPILGLAKTVGTSALIATGALELPALATWGGLGARALVGGAQGLGYGNIGLGTGNPVDDFTYGAAGEVGIPLVGGLLKGARAVGKSTDVPKKQFQSEIDWGKWNEEIPGNKELMQEYKTIEQSSKADGSWMKNPDGSAFNGTPEQFVQQNSSNFKKSFPNIIKEDGKVVPLIHHSRNSFDYFDEGKALSNTGMERYGRGVYTIPEPFYNKRVAKNLKELMDESSGKSVLTNYGDIRYDLYSNSNNITKHSYRNRINVTPKTKYEDIFTVVSPYTNRLKSAIGNNGMFDMTNPNIYKGLIPAAGLYGLTQSKKQGGNMKYTSLFKLGGPAKILYTGGTSPNPWRKVSGSFNGVNYQGEVFSDKSKTDPSLGYVIYKDNNGKKFSRDLEGVITYDPKSTTQDSIAFQSILNNNGFNYGKGPATQSLDLLNSKMKEMKDDPWFKERGQKK